MWGLGTGSDIRAIALAHLVLAPAPRKKNIRLRAQLHHFRCCLSTAAAPSLDPTHRPQPYAAPAHHASPFTKFAAAYITPAYPVPV
jgi:hypothetical protein